jgi:hypothetical protein
VITDENVADDVAAMLEQAGVKLIVAEAAAEVVRLPESA